jgi:hypothetical protein
VIVVAITMRTVTMPKYYIQCGSLSIIYSTDKSPLEAACASVWECNENDTLDEYFYIDERGYRGYTNADKETTVITTESIMKHSGWTME